MTDPLRGPAGGLRAQMVAPRVRIVHNSELPYSLNDGSLWAGRGVNASIVTGVEIRLNRLRLIAAPELSFSENEDYILADPSISPPVPSSRNPFSSPWHAAAQSIDLPIRFGPDPIGRVAPGQSSLLLDAGPVTVGASTENEWWGPGIRNALLLSNNAPGFPHLLVRTARPVDTRIGSLEARWIAGGLTESRWFDSDPSNDLRAISLLGVALQPRGTTGLVVGASRAVFSATSNWASALTSFPTVLLDVGQPNAVAPTDSTHPRGRDALLSLFARYVVPSEGLEIYGEVGRAEMPVSLRDLLEQPTHTQGWTVGLQWLGPTVVRTHGRFRLHAEVTNVEQSTSFRFRPIGSWYTSHTVEQGYTERGQTLGAAIGPGSSSQWLAIDHLSRTWALGGYLTRVRWLEDAHGQKDYPGDIAYCAQDVSFLPGIRGRRDTSVGSFSADYSSGWRLNVFFEHQGICFQGPSRDERNRSLTFTFTPRLPGR